MEARGEGAFRFGGLEVKSKEKEGPLELSGSHTGEILWRDCCDQSRSEALPYRGLRNPSG